VTRLGEDERMAWLSFFDVVSSRSSQGLSDGSRWSGLFSRGGVQGWGK